MVKSRRKGGSFGDDNDDDPDADWVEDKEVVQGGTVTGATGATGVAAPQQKWKRKSTRSADEPGFFAVHVDLHAMHTGDSRRAETSEILIAVTSALNLLVNTEMTAIPVIDRMGNEIGIMEWNPLVPDAPPPTDSGGTDSGSTSGGSEIDSGGTSGGTVFDSGGTSGTMTAGRGRGGHTR